MALMLELERVNSLVTQIVVSLTCICAAKFNLTSE